MRCGGRVRRAERRRRRAACAMRSALLRSARAAWRWTMRGAQPARAPPAGGCGAARARRAAAAAGSDREGGGAAAPVAADGAPKPPFEGARSPPPAACGCQSAGRARCTRSERGASCSRAAAALPSRPAGVRRPAAAPAAPGRAAALCSGRSGSRAAQRLRTSIRSRRTALPLPAERAGLRDRDAHAGYAETMRWPLSRTCCGAYWRRRRRARRLARATKPSTRRRSARPQALRVMLLRQPHDRRTAPTFRRVFGAATAPPGHDRAQSSEPAGPPPNGIKPRATAATLAVPSSRAAAASAAEADAKPDPPCRHAAAVGTPTTAACDERRLAAPPSSALATPAGSASVQHAVRGAVRDSCGRSCAGDAGAASRVCSARRDPSRRHARPRSAGGPGRDAASTLRTSAIDAERALHHPAAERLRAVVANAMSAASAAARRRARPRPLQASRATPVAFISSPHRLSPRATERQPPRGRRGLPGEDAAAPRRSERPPTQLPARRATQLGRRARAPSTRSANGPCFAEAQLQPTARGAQLWPGGQSRRAGGSLPLARLRGAHTARGGGGGAPPRRTLERAPGPRRRERAPRAAKEPVANVARRRFRVLAAAPRARAAVGGALDGNPYGSAAGRRAVDAPRRRRRRSAAASARRRRIPAAPE